MMGAGKTTIGRRLARRLGWSFIDADRELEDRLGVSVATIFEMEGEAGFRAREAALMDELTQRVRIVLATGGGVVLDASNRTVLRERGRVIYLRATAADLWQRLRRDRSRPLLRVPDPRGRLASLLAQREPLYESVAHCTLDTGRQSVERLLEHILDHPELNLRKMIDA
jgi:shikimate kinase